MELTSRIQILDEAVSVSIHADNFDRGMKGSEALDRQAV